MSSRAQHDYSRTSRNKAKTKEPQLGANVFIERDYAHGMATRFETQFPAVLALRVRFSYSIASIMIKNLTMFIYTGRR